MGAFEDLLKKQGYVKLDRYGLVLTDDDRILSTRPAVLDDGLGGKIVGWADGDLAAAELEQWGAAKKPATANAVAANPGLQSRPPARVTGQMPTVAPPPTPVRVTGQMPAVRLTAPVAVVAPAPFAAPAPIAATAPIAAPAVTKPAQVAAEPVVEEDEWEWEIAMARARAVSDEVQAAAAMIASGFTKPSAPRKPSAPKKTMPMDAVVPRTLAAGSGPIAKDPMSSWPQTEPLNESWSDATRENAPQVMSPVAKQIAVAKTSVRANTPVTPVAVPLFEAAAAAAASTQQSRTVIPVPALPVAKPGDVRPAFNPGQPPPRLASKRAQPSPNVRSRMARGTEPQKSHDDATVVTAPVQPANDELTSPYVTLPSEVKPTGFAHTKRVAAKHR